MYEQKMAADGDFSKQIPKEYLKSAHFVAESMMVLLFRPQSLRVFSLLVFLASGLAAVGQSPSSAVKVLQNQYGKVYGTRLVAITGADGEPTPKEWHLFAYDLNNPTRVSHFVVKGGKIVNANLLDDQRSRNWAAKVLAWDRVKISSDQAFKIADATARAAQISFDSLDYRLVTDRQTQLPVYMLELKDRGKNIVGYVKIDANDGRVMSQRWPGKSGFVGPWSGQENIDWQIVKEEMGKVGRGIGGAFKKLGQNVGNALQR